MPGGIQPGTTASSPASIKLDAGVREAAHHVFKELKQQHPSLGFKRGLTGAELFELLIKPTETLTPEELIVGCQPDGGIFFFRDIPVCSFEAKKQNDAGNAIERWYKNFFIFSNLNLSIQPLYVTFAVGAGAAPNGIISKTLLPALLCLNREFDVLYPYGLSIFRQPEGFTDSQLRALITDAVLRGIQLVETAK